MSWFVAETSSKNTRRKESYFSTVACTSSTQKAEMDPYFAKLTKKLYQRDDEFSCHGAMNMMMEDLSDGELVLSLGSWMPHTSLSIFLMAFAAFCCVGLRWSPVGGKYKSFLLLKDACCAPCCGRCQRCWLDMAQRLVTVDPVMHCHYLDGVGDQNGPCCDLMNLRTQRREHIHIRPVIRLQRPRREATDKCRCDQQRQERSNLNRQWA